MVRQPSTVRADPTSINRRQYLSAGIASLSLVALPAVGATQTEPTAPGVRHRRTYENLWITGTTSAHGGGRVLVGRKGSRPDPEDPVRVAVVDADGEIQQRTAITPELPDEAHATPDVVRTDDGYAVAAGPWLVRLDTGLSIRSTGKNPDVEASKHTSLVSLPDGFVAGFTEWLPNAFWTHFVGFDAEGSSRWYHEYNVNGSQALNFLVADGDGGALAGGTFPWLAELDAEGTFQAVELPENLPSGVLNAGVRDGDGLVLCSGNQLVRLDADYQLDWSRTYNALGDEHVRELTKTSDGGFLFLTGGVSIADAQLCKTDASGTLLWHHSYQVNSADDTRIKVLAETSPGEYLIAGGSHLSTAGWALRLSTDETPTPSPTPTPTESLSQTPTATVKTPITETPATDTPSDADSDSTTSTAPGFGAVTGGLAFGGAVLVRALRDASDD